MAIPNFFNNEGEYLNWYSTLTPAEQADPQNIASDNLFDTPGYTVVDTYVEVYAGRTANGTTSQFSRNSTTTRTNTGRWEVRFDFDHADGDQYVPCVTAEEQSANRDTPDITIVQGTQNQSGFDLQIVTGDNGGTADVYVDTPFVWSVCAPVRLPILK